MMKKYAWLAFGMGLSLLTNANAIAITSAAAGPATPVITHHTGTFNGKRIEYDAIVEPIVVANDAGKPAARIVVTTYLANT
ncbi:MAG TPA: hypothetical protein VHB68_13065, partial [Steroidobacteraceae bacterium]|nr:hypothetical protein [Steroidobacteraceae bacterium]